MRIALCALLLLAGSAAAQVDPEALAAERARVEAIAKARPAVLAVCFYGGEACGSGVVIDAAGYALTNFHVVQPTGTVLQCGMPDGKLYDAVLVGQDRVGDVALVKLLPREPGKPFPFAPLGDSDAVRAGDWSLAMGNPFGLSLDFTPTVTFGLVSGVNRYQPPEGRGTLEYTDCIQVEASINPGNSGGPLFNMKGELIGINGRGSFEKRGRVNSGVGYAISINQIKHFLGHLKVGLDCDHASLGAAVETENEDGDLAKMVVREVLADSDADRRGLQPGDQLVSFAGRPLASVNQFKNVLGIYPKGWRLPLTSRRDGAARTALVRLAGTLSEVAEPEAKVEPGMPKPKAKAAGLESSPAKKLYEAKPGFANYYFNREAQKALKQATIARGDFAKEHGTWVAAGTVKLADREGAAAITFGETPDGLAQVKLDRGGVVDAVSPLKVGAPEGELQSPQGSGGLLAALYQWRRLLTQWDAGFEGGFDHGGHEPWHAPGEPDAAGTMCEVLKTRHGALDGKWYFDLATRRLVGLESSVNAEDDPCELSFGDYRAVAGRELPHLVTVRVGERVYATIRVNTYTFSGKP